MIAPKNAHGYDFAVMRDEGMSRRELETIRRIVKKELGGTSEAVQAIGRKKPGQPTAFLGIAFNAFNRHSAQNVDDALMLRRINMRTARVFMMN